MKIERNLRTFLKQVQRGQSLNLAAWAHERLQGAEISEADYQKAIRLGFTPPASAGEFTEGYDRQGRKIKMFIPNK